MLSASNDQDSRVNTAIVDRSIDMENIYQVTWSIVGGGNQSHFSITVASMLTNRDTEKDRIFREKIPFSGEKRSIDVCV